MTRYYKILGALRHYVGLHFANPKLSKCILVSLLLVVATAGPIARAQQHLSKSHSSGMNIRVVLGELGMKPFLHWPVSH